MKPDKLGHVVIAVMIVSPTPMEHVMRSLAITLVLSILFVGLGWKTVAQPPAEPAVNTLTKQEKKDGWKLLFDGKTLNGWRIFKQKDTGKWSVRAGGIMVSGSEGRDLMTNDQYANFEFQCDWKNELGNNSGIIYRVGEEGTQTWQTGMEMQIENHAPKAKIGKTGGGSLYGMFAPIENLQKPAAEWNTYKVVADGKHLEHWVNDSRVMECDIGSDAWKQAQASSKWKNEKLYATKASGHIALQDHGKTYRVIFRNIKIHVLPDTPSDKK